MLITSNFLIGFMITSNNRPHRQTSNDTRQRIIAALNNGMNLQVVAAAHSVKLYTVDRIWKKYQAGGGTNKERVGGNKPKKYKSINYILWLNY